MPVIYMDRASIESLTEKDIREIIDENSTDVKYGMLHDYYVGNHRILGENKKDSTAPNNRLVNNMAKYITDTATGYFLGEPIVLSLVCGTSSIGRMQNDCQEDETVPGAG